LTSGVAERIGEPAQREELKGTLLNGIGSGSKSRVVTNDLLTNR
jgi:hypothetical protein